MMVSISSVVVSLFVSGSYVAAIYSTSRNLDDYKTKRDDPRVIRLRIRQVIKVCCLNLVIIPYLLENLAGNGGVWSYFVKLGLIPGFYYDGSFDLYPYVLDILKAFLLICLLYVGVIIDSFFYYLIDSSSSFVDDFVYEVNSLWGFRNFVFAPITEEIFYTAMLITTYLSLNSKDSLSYKKCLLELPLYFGLAHIHHAYEDYQMGQHTVPTIILSTAFQLCYTTLFGCLTNYVFLMTGGNLWACIVLHSFCNFMGFPQSSKVKQYYQYSKPLKDDDFSTKARLIRAWYKMYIVLLVMGLLFFKDYVTVLTNNKTHRINL